MDKFKLFIISAAAAGLAMFFVLDGSMTDQPGKSQTVTENSSIVQNVDNETKALPSMTIESLGEQAYPGGYFVVEKILPDGINYEQSIVSYQSESLKIYGLLTVPKSQRPENGFPSVVFVHGYIPPKQYSTTGSYPSYQAALARSNFITFKPDLRGHGQSEGESVSAHFSEKYVIDILNAIAYLKRYKDADPERLGYWGHSNGGEIGLRISVISKDIKAYSFWAGVVGSYVDELETYNDKIRFMQGPNSLVEEHGLPSRNPDFWKKIDPYFYLDDIFAPIQLQHATGDESVPVELSQHLRDELQKRGKKIEYIEYGGDDHNIGKNSSLAWQRTIQFFRDNL